ncbi:hypothetical protein Hanom_Chr07g00667651 [Helianthus anomalus]
MNKVRKSTILIKLITCYCHPPLVIFLCCTLVDNSSVSRQSAHWGWQKTRHSR